MKIFIALFITTVSLNAFAVAVPGLYFTDAVGKKAQPVTYFSSEEMCFEGKVSEVSLTLWSALNDDIEKLSFFVRPDRLNNEIVYGYTDTKCLDENDPELNCAVLKTIPACY